MKMYLSVFRIRFVNLMQYRIVAVGSILTRFVWGFMEIMAYLALYRSSGTQLPMDLSQTVSYIWMQQVFMCFFRFPMVMEKFSIPSATALSPMSWFAQ